MAHDEGQVEQLHQAVERLRAGQSLEVAGRGLEPSQRALLASAARLAAAGSLQRGPRPSFVLRLEEQLRTDVRLRLVGRRGRGRRLQRVMALLVVLIVVALAAFYVKRTDSLPGRPLGGALAGDRGNLLARQVGEALDSVWIEVEALEQLMTPHADPMAVPRRLAAVRSQSALALQLAQQADSERLVARVGAELEAVADELDRLANRSGGGGEPFRQTAQWLRRNLALPPPLALSTANSVRLVLSDRLAATATWTQPRPTATASPSAIAWPSATQTGVPTPALTRTATIAASPIPGATAVREPPTASPTIARESPVPSPAVASPTAGSEPGPILGSPTATRDDHKEPTSTTVPTIVVPATIASPPEASPTPPLAHTPGLPPPTAPPLAP